MDEKTNWQSLEKNGPITEYNEPFIEQRADPFVCKAADGTYYVTALNHLKSCCFEAARL